MTPRDLQQFRQLLDNFVFFHLGADARVDLQAAGDEVVIAIEHGRVRPFQWRLRGSEVARLVADPSSFEDAMLDQLTIHRRS